MTISKLTYISGVVALILGAASCNSKDDDTTPTYTPSTSMAITAFSLKEDNTVAADLDSVYFAIDLDRGIIFNADSLPKGSNISALVPKITASSTASSVTITMTDGEVRTGEVDYLNAPYEEIDFTGKVTITVVSQDGSMSKNYQVKVNVHQQDPDIMLWQTADMMKLPSRLPNAASQSTVGLGEKTLCMIEESDGSYTLSSTTSVADDRWQKTALQLPFTPDLSTLTGNGTTLYILSTQGDLYTSADGLSWEATGERWQQIVGPYKSGVVGIATSDEGRRHVCWPAGLCSEPAVSADFPIYGWTRAGSIESLWSPNPTLIIYGGKLPGGEYSGSVWAFDGTEWARITETGGPKVVGATLIPYWISRQSGSRWNYANRDAWLVVGGIHEDGTANRETWYSLDNGIHWVNGGDSMSLPEEIGSFAFTDAVVSLQRREASATQWAKVPRRLSVSVEGSTIVWQCPEIYLFGGIDPILDGAGIYQQVRRATLARYTFIPII